VEPGTWKDELCYRYRTREVDGLEDLTGRIIIQFNRSFRASYLRDPKFVDKLVVAQIRERRMTIGDFPGYNSVLLSYRMLKTVVREANPSWRTALANVAGVYVIADGSDANLYVGSACGRGGIWQRWTSYAKTGHGGNKELRSLLLENGDEHAENFQFSLLEVCDLNSNGGFVLARESHWKTVLWTREFGLNRS
jgi:hypothetical protein